MQLVEVTITLAITLLSLSGALAKGDESPTARTVYRIHHHRETSLQTRYKASSGP